MRQPQLGVLLVATAFLALPLLIDDVMRQAAIAGAAPVVRDGPVENRPIIADDADGHDSLDAAGVPVAVGKGGEVFEDRIENGTQHPPAAVAVLERPVWACGTDEFRSVHELETSQRGAQLFVLAGDLFQRARPGVEDFDCLVGMGRRPVTHHMIAF